jgi:YVTN family beta-propeller protein
VSTLANWFSNATVIASAFLVVSCASQGSPSQPPIATHKPTTPLVTGKEIAATQPSAQSLANLPMTMLSTRDGRFAVVCSMGYRTSLLSVDMTTGHIVNTIDFASHAVPRPPAKSDEEDTHYVAPPPEQTNGVYYGLAVDGDGVIYAAQGAHDTIAVLSVSSTGELSMTGSIAAQAGDFPAGLAVDDHHHLYVTNNSSNGTDHPYRWPASVAIYDTTTKAPLGRYTFDSPAKTSNFLLGIAVLRDGSKTYAASERDGAVYVLNSKDPAHPTLLTSISTGSHPVATVLNKSQSRLFVANAQSDTISVIDTATDRTVGTILLRPDAVRGLPGASPTSLAFSPDEKTLYVTLSDMNAVGVVDVDSMTLRGLMPTGWYPSAIMATADNRLMVVNAKGSEPRRPNAAYNPFKRPVNRALYILNNIPGNIESIPVPTADELQKQTDEVMAENHFNQIQHPAENPLAGIGLAAGKIKHVIYIIKENRTYDQVLGDEPTGDGDPSLVLFGKTITPNQHALVERFVLLDNCYACGEVSGDGWTWSTQGIANAYVERNIPYQYSNRGRTFDYEGENNGYITGGFPAKDPDGKPLSTDPAYANGAPAVPDVAAASTHLWDVARVAGLSIRNYGFFLSIGDKNGPTVAIPENYPTAIGLQPPGHDLAGITDMDFRRFDLDYPDSDAPQTYFAQTSDPNCQYRRGTFGKYEMPSRFSECNREFQMMLQRDPSGNAVPALMLVRLPHDHTQAMSPRKHSPASEVADNDFGVGQLVDAVSHSAIWPNTAIFIIEDDAQAGPDHVDCHRTTCYVASPWIKRASVDHHFYNTDSVLRTMELLLGLPPMSQYDAIASPIMDWDTTPSNIGAFNATLPPKDVIAAINAPPTSQPSARSDETNELMTASAKMDFDHADAAPADVVNEIVWKSVKGMDSKMPAPRNTLVSPIKPAKDKDDDD